MGSFLVFFFECYGDHRDLHVLTHSFPTRRSSDLVRLLSVKRGCRPRYSASDRPAKKSSGRQMNRPSTSPSRKPASAIASMDALAASSSEVWPRSEEHTSELQSLMRSSYAVFCLKKKQRQLTNTQYQSDNRQNT